MGDGGADVEGGADVVGGGGGADVLGGGAVGEGVGGGGADVVGGGGADDGLGAGEPVEDDGESSVPGENVDSGLTGDAGNGGVADVKARVETRGGVEPNGGDRNEKLEPAEPGEVSDEEPPV